MGQAPFGVYLALPPRRARERSTPEGTTRREELTFTCLLIEEHTIIPLFRYVKGLYNSIRIFHVHLNVTGVAHTLRDILDVFAQY